MRTHINFLMKYLHHKINIVYPLNKFFHISHLYAE